MSNEQLYSAEIAQDSLESLFAAHGPQRPYTYWIILFGAIAGLASLPLVKVDVSVRAQGLVRPRTERTELKAAVSGHIAQVLAHDNDMIKAGQPLLVLRTNEVDERIARNHSRQNEHKLATSDLEWLVSPVRTAVTQSSGPHLAVGAPVVGPVVLVSGVGVVRAAEDEQKAFGDEVRFEGAPALATAQYRQEFAQFQAQLNSYALAEQKARGELARYTALSAKGIATQQELDNARYEVERLAAEKKLVGEQALARWQGTLRDEKVALADLATEAQRLNEELTQYTVRAPADGVLVGFSGLSGGGFIAAGQSLGAVSPEDTLRVETYVAPKDVGLVRIGQAARIQVDAFPYTQWGTLDGIVESVSGDMLSGSGSTVFFKVIVRPAKTMLKLPSGVAGELRKGMTLSARFLVAKRSLLQILYEDVSNWLDPDSHQGAGF